jgi:hypothetical protein
LEGEEKTFICIHVDDSFVFSNKKEYIDKLRDLVTETMQVTVEHNSNSFLGINFEQLVDGSVKLTQPKLVKKVLSKYKMNSKKKSKNNYPFAPERREDDPRKNTPSDPEEYQSLLGILLYLTKSRPELNPVTSFGGTQAKDPSEEDFEELLYAVEFLRKDPERGLILHTIHFKGFKLILYSEVDASYLLHKDSKGHSGYCIGFARVGFFYFKSKKQSMVATSATHAEVQAAVALVKELLYIIYMCKELKMPLHLPSIVMEDNSAVVQIATEECSVMKRCKHFLRDINILREHGDAGVIEIRKIPGEKNSADNMSKRNRGINFTGKNNEKIDKLTGYKRPFPSGEPEDYIDEDVKDSEDKDPHHKYIRK